MAIPVLTRVTFAAVLLILPFFSAAYPAPADKQAPVAQVYAVQGKAAVTGPSGGSAAEVEKGCMVGLQDSLILESDASVGLYFKTGGKKEIRAKDGRTAYKVAELAPRTQAYSQNVPLFGATRGLEVPDTGSQTPGFFYPQEAVILDTAPSIEFTVFDGSGEGGALSGASVQIAKNGTVLNSRRFDRLEYGAAYVYQPPKLQRQEEYAVELRFELQKALGTVLTVSFPLYIAAASDMASKSPYGLFSDSVYRSFESTSVDHNNTKRSVTLIKQLVKRSGSPQPAIVIELFIP